MKSTSHGRLTYVNGEALDRTPALSDFKLNNNHIWAIPVSSNHIEG